MMEWTELLGKKIFVILKSKLHYTGIVRNIDDNFISIRDKFGKIVTFSTDEISIIKENGND